MKWRIAGADRATGEERLIVVDAVDERDAALRAKENNLLVAEMITEEPAAVRIKTPDSSMANRQFSPMMLVKTAFYIIVAGIVVTIGTWQLQKYTRYRALLEEYYQVAPTGARDAEKAYNQIVDLNIRTAGLGKPPLNSQYYFDRWYRAKEIRREIVLLGYEAPPE